MATPQNFRKIFQKLEALAVWSTRRLRAFNNFRFGPSFAKANNGVRDINVDDHAASARSAQ